MTICSSSIVVSCVQKQKLSDIVLLLVFFLVKIKDVGIFNIVQNQCFASTER